MGELIIPKFDTPSDSQVSISLDIGIVPKGYPNAGQYIITIQAWPLPDRSSADRIAKAMREAIGSRLGVKLEEQS
jgi:hypothetical protein